MNANIVVFDTETTGIDCASDRLVELAGVSYDNPSLQFSTLVNPERDIPPEAQAIHHISRQETEGAPRENEALGEFLRAFPSDRPLVLAAHNVKFDRGFVTRINPALDVYYICTLKLAYTCFPNAPAFGNQVLRYYLDLKVDVPEGLFPHRALYDCIVTRAILEKCLEQYSLREAVQRSNNPVLLPKVFFGKHKGETWDKVPFGYLKWITNNMADNEDAVHTAHHWMRRN